MAEPYLESQQVTNEPFERLTAEEDDELRRLNYLSKMGPLSQRSQERFIELRLRDRRKEIREPREFGNDGRPSAEPGPKGVLSFRRNR